jgi:hypothetical protein
MLQDASEDAWRRVQASKAPWASDEYSPAARTILAKYIVTVAKGGERDAKMVSRRRGSLPLATKALPEGTGGSLTFRTT